MAAPLVLRRYIRFIYGINPRRIIKVGGRQRMMLMQPLQAIEARVRSLVVLQSAGFRTRSYDYSRDRKSEEIKKEFRQNWCKRLLIRDFAFECDTDEATYITRPDDAVSIHTAAHRALTGMECRWFIDAFACVGGDTLAAMNQFKRANIFAVQRISDATESERFGRLQRNLETFTNIVKGRPPEARVHAIGKDIKTFITTEVPLRATISILHLDPPWVLDPASKSFSSPEQIRRFLEDEVWTPLQARDAQPYVIVLKLPKHFIQDIAQWPTLRARYQEIQRISPRERFTVHILRRVDHMGA